jgi:putative ABC transport system permease protein
VTQIITGETMRQAQAGHVEVLVVSLLAISIIVAAVGIIGLASSQATSVTERIRAFGIMRTVGAPSRTIVSNVLAEGAMIGLLSLPLALLLGLPLGYGIGLLVGTLSFGLALPLVVSSLAVLVWVGLLFGGSVASSIVPAISATRITVRQALAHL